MTQSNSDFEDKTAAAVAAIRATAATRAGLVDMWQSTKKSFAFALAADDYTTAWQDRLTKSSTRIRELTSQDADVALYMMQQSASNDAENYSSNHGIYCAVVAQLCSAYLEWPDVEANALHSAALTMNIGMLLAQNSMSQQVESPSPAQQQRIQEHPARSVELLKISGINDPLWLETVRRHHRPLDEGEVANPQAPPQRLAQLLQRIDVFTAKLSRRKARPGSTATIAARDACLDASGLPDATGATMLRVLGLYPPGSFVELVSGDIGVVIRRGDKAHTPVVGCVRRADGGIISQPVAVDTGLRPNAIRFSLAADEVKMRLDHERVVSAKS
jgi:hypothetical protein